MNEIALLEDGCDLARVTAWMYFPRDRALRELHVERFKLREALGSGLGEDGLLSVSAGVLQSILDGPGKSEFAAIQVDAVKQGVVAGDLLHLIYQMHQQGDAEPSLGKALKEYQAFSLGPKYGDKTPLKRAEQTLRDCLEAFAPSAHLWAAFRINGPFPYVEDPRDLFGSHEGLHRFLGVAKAVREFATTFVPKRTRPAKPVIEADVMVKIAESIPALRLSLSTQPQ